MNPWEKSGVYQGRRIARHLHMEVTEAEVRAASGALVRPKLNWAHWYAVEFAFWWHPAKSVAWWEDMFKRAREAHHIYEDQLPGSDPNWATWYAKWLTEQSSLVD
jgi:hypothetical protein